jgi:hypothetical protein
MFLLATPIVDWNAMWKIFLVALAAGAGVVIFFGFMLLGLKLSQGPPTHDPSGARTDGAPGAATAAAPGAGTDGVPVTRTDHTPSAGARLGGFTIALVCGLICVGVVAVGIYAMTQKPKSKPAKPKSALVIPAGSRVKLIASAR